MDLLFNALLQEHAFITVVKKLLEREREKYIDGERVGCLFLAERILKCNYTLMGICVCGCL